MSYHIISYYIVSWHTAILMKPDVLINPDPAQGYINPLK